MMMFLRKNGQRVNHILQTVAARSTSGSQSQDLNGFAVCYSKTRHLVPMVANEGILYFGISTKYAIAFFKLSRFIVRRFTCCSSCLIFSS
jgi:hypothetical protein